MYHELFWEEKENQAKQQLQIEKKKSNYYSWARLLSMALSLLGLFLKGGFHQPIGTLLFIVFLVLFLFLVYFHHQSQNKISKCEKELEVINEMKQRRGNEWTLFEEKGDEFQKIEENLCHDLDLIGPHSLFQRFCIAKSYQGKKKIFDDFVYGAKNVVAHQQAIEEIAANQEFVFQFLVEMKKRKPITQPQEEKMNQLLMKLNQIHDNAFYKIAYLFHFILCICFLLAFFSWISYGYVALLCMIQLILSILFSIRYFSSFACLKEMSKIFQMQLSLFELLEKYSFQSSELKEKMQSFQDGQALVAIKQLDQNLSLLSLHNNLFLYLILNALGMIDIHIFELNQRWLKKYLGYMPLWQETISDLEALVSLSLVGYALDETCIPIFHLESMIQATQCAHPLLDEKQVVCNSFELKQMNLLTGSNMSGKSTFMRCVGVNMILAMAGCRVKATSFHTSIYRVLTSMRVQDELSQGISSFYAEILRIKNIMETIQKEENYLVLIDEIFKGTNSQDRIIGAKEAIIRLMRENVLCIVTTHDLELCELSPKITNYHFSEYYENDQICFDYLLKKGKCQTKNAIHLMKMAGILE